MQRRYPRMARLITDGPVLAKALAVAIAGTLVAGCGITSRLEPYKQTDAVLEEGDQVVVLARRHHATHETEQKFVDCVSHSLADSKQSIEVHDSIAFENLMYPWFEPSTAPLSTADLTELLEKPGVLEQVRNTGVRFVVWLDGSTDRIASGGGITCAAGVGGAGCMGLAWWEDDSKYDATIWDMRELSSAGTIHADVRGRSVMPAIIIPIPFIARPQSHACRGITEQLEQFLTTPQGYGAGPDLG